MDLSFIDLDVGVYNELGEERVSLKSGKIYYKPVVSQSLKPVIGMVFDSVEIAYDFYVSYAHASGFSVRKNNAYTNHGLLKLKAFPTSVLKPGPDGRPVQPALGVLSGLSFINLDVGVYNELGEEHVSPRSGKIYYKPVVSQSLKPVIGMVFDSVELAYGFYVSYAHASGFSVRKNSAYTNHGLLKLKYYVCSNEGFKSESEYSTLDNANTGKRKRRKPLNRTGCGEHIKFRLNDKDKYEVYVFEEEHNHSFVHKDNILFLTSARRVDYVKKIAIQALSQVNLGPVRAFNILKSLYGGYEQIWYDMVFVPFTGINNHNKNITLGAALLGSETADSYRAIQDVFPNTDIDYVGPTTPNVAELKIVWTDSITTDEFEEKWPSILSEYGLSDHEWLADL
ncbi:protein FAR1-RELATED SEQUENCE 7-like [Bidens hawaiensis]|uniref:protein FAR1-RELATED SEQUENCE 7-like n=1 Tax=Bidens hawaiensis TaxID=980011 RepID=UPI00404B95D1